MNTLERSAKELSARVAAFSKYSKKKKPIISPYVSKSPKTLSEHIAALGIPKAPRIVERPVYLGEPGKRGDKGEKGEKGNTGKDGRHGRDGETPIKGQHYLTKTEIDGIKQEIVSSIRFPEQEKIQLPKPLEVDQEFVKKIVQIMHSLPENDKLEVSKGIRNSQSFIFGNKKYQVSELMHGGGSSTGGTSTPLAPTGIVNGSNQIFGVTAPPSSVVSDGITYFPGAGFLYSNNQITLDVPPSEYIRYYA